MAIVKKFKPLTFVERIYLPPILKGLSITVRHMFANFFGKDSITIRYPEQRKVMPDYYRGLHILPKWEDGHEKCVACEMCSTVCPSKAITVFPEESTEPGHEKRPRLYEIDMLRCIFCGFCEEVCPRDAIKLTRVYELCDTDRRSFIYNKPQLMSTDKRLLEDEAKDKKAKMKEC
jgi:NADH-quinone oxidoreductase subunit I